MTLQTPCLFGLESVLASEIRRIGGKDVAATDGKVSFSGDEAILARANIRLRCAERVCIVLGSFEAKSFTELFDNVEKLNFEDFIGKNDAFPVTGWSLKSGLYSVPDCQSIIKKAAVKRLQKVYGQSWFEETGERRQIRFSILKDYVTVMLDTSGAGLHKRGYRQTSTEAPLKETLAAGIADIARVGPDDTVIDPMCGSGTLLIESALRAYRIAPGVRRRFDAEKWEQIPKAVWREERESAISEIKKDIGFFAKGYDTDELAVRLTAENAGKAGVSKRIDVQIKDIADFKQDGANAVILCNPPYGERLLEIREAEMLYKKMGEVFERRDGFRYYIISPHEDFEALFGRPADKRRKLYNGMIKCQLFMYFK